jgi:hypothetical protein
MNLDAKSTAPEGFELTFWFKTICTSPTSNSGVLMDLVGGLESDHYIFYFLSGLIRYV